MKGYFKGELRTCECGGAAGTINPVVCRTCGNKSLTIESWNTRPAFDKAIDALIELTLGLCDDCIIHESECKFCYDGGMGRKTVKDTTGLTWAEALEIYKQRQEEEI